MIDFIKITKKSEVRSQKTEDGRPEEIGKPWEACHLAELLNTNFYMSELF